LLAAWSLRVVIDTVLLLRLNNVLSITLKTTLSSSLLVVAAYVLFIIAPGLITQIVTTALLISLSLTKDRKIIQKAYRYVRPNTVVDI
jgi:UPF0716 family protein affecting phage T7 exclusion